MLGEEEEEEEKKKNLCLPRRYFPGCPKCAAICKSLGYPPDTVYLSPIRCTSANRGQKKNTIAVILAGIGTYITSDSYIPVDVFAWSSGRYSPVSINRTKVRG